MAETARRPSPTALFRIIIGMVACGLLLWGIVTTALGAQAVRLRNPQLMVVFAAHPDAATALATLQAAAGQSGDAEVMARRAVLADPLNVKALTLLGFALQRQGREPEATSVLRQAASMGWRQTGILTWGLQDAARNNHPDRVVDIADALARRQRVGTLTRTVFFGALDEPGLRRRFVQRLAMQPSWRPGFFADVHDRLAPAQFDGMDQMLRALRATSAPPTAAETLIYVDRMVQLGAIGRARRYWASVFRIAAADLAMQPFDGQFTRAAAMNRDAPTGVFDWRLNPDLEDLAAFETEAGSAALRIEPGIPNGAVIASQTLTLSPGDRVLETRLAAGSGASAPAGWTITCQGSEQPLLRSLSRTDRDELSRVAVTIPAQGCPAQILRLIGIDRMDARPATIVAVTIR